MTASKINLERKKSAGQNTELTPDKEQVHLNYCLFMAKSSHPFKFPISKPLLGPKFAKVLENLD